jgi:4-hydroxybenzoate polyprenyltransferase
MIKNMKNKMHNFAISSRISGLPYIGIIFLPLCITYWSILDFSDVVYICLSVIGYIYGMLINNYYDYEIDAKYRSEKIGFTKKELKNMSKIFGSLYIVTNWYLSLISLSNYYLLGGTSTFLIVSIYTPFLKSKPLIKNVSTVAYMCFIPIHIFIENQLNKVSDDVDENFKNSLIISLPLSFLILIREILLDINDVDEDIAAGIVTLPILFKKNKIRAILKKSVTVFWITGLYFRVVSIRVFPCQVGLISGISAYVLYRIDCTCENREFMIGILWFYLLWNFIFYISNITIFHALIGLCGVLNIIFSKNSSVNQINPNIWSVFCRKLVHMCIGCLALSIKPMTTAYIVISVKTVLNILLPRFSLGIEKKEEISLIEDTGVKYWLYFLLLWAITNVDRNNNTNWEIYNQALPFFISDPSAAMVGRTTFTSEKIILWRNKSLQGTFMVILTAYALNKSIKLSIGIGLVELFGCEYDNALIGGLLLANLLKQKYF